MTEHTQQLVARIKRSSKYWGQTDPNAWFDVRVVDDASYRLRGNDNNYRLRDVALGIRLANGVIVELASGRTISAEGAREQGDPPAHAEHVSDMTAAPCPEANQAVRARA